MKKVWLKMYLKNNLGDDLFLKILLDRYQNTLFYVQASCNYRNNTLKKYKNVKIISKKYNRFLNIILKFKGKKYYEVIQNKCDYKLLLGGSMFIEKENFKNEIENIFFKVKKPYFILGTNFGPYYSNEYLKNYKKVFENSLDTCFRDNKSYELFKDLKNTRVSTDIVFSLKKENVSNNGSIVISVINLDKRNDLKEYKEDYENKIIELCNYYSKTNKVILMSFCKSEGDEEAINRILKKCKNKVYKYFYRGNVLEAIDVIKNCETVVATRFHASILGLHFGKKVIPIIYSDKTKNVLEDINYSGDIVDIENIKSFDIKNFKYNLNKLDIKGLDQFKVLDENLTKN